MFLYRTACAAARDAGVTTAKSLRSFRHTPCSWSGLPRGRGGHGRSEVCTRDRYRSVSRTFNGRHPRRSPYGTVVAIVLIWREHVESALERRHAAAEAVRQQRELERVAAETSRNAAEQSRAAAETGRRAVTDEVRGTIATLKIVLDRMEAVEALRRDARSARSKDVQE